MGCCVVKWDLWLGFGLGLFKDIFDDRGALFWIKIESFLKIEELFKDRCHFSRLSLTFYYLRAFYQYQGDF